VNYRQAYAMLTAYGCDPAQARDILESAETQEMRVSLDGAQVTVVMGKTGFRITREAS
jgi:hypothetical protein